jgi:hypothetical protein
MSAAPAPRVLRTLDTTSPAWRQTTAVRDFADPPFTVIGSDDERTANRMCEVYEKLSTPVERTTIRESEVVLVSKKGVQFADAIKQLPDDRIVIDLVRLFPQANGRPHHYEGMCW